MAIADPEKKLTMIEVLEHALEAVGEFDTYEGEEREEEGIVEWIAKNDEVADVLATTIRKMKARQERMNNGHDQRG